MAKLTGRIIDKETGAEIAARVQVLSAGGTLISASSITESPNHPITPRS